MQTFAVFLVVFVSCGLSCRGMVIGKEKCDPDRLAVYRIVLDTHWSRDLFPKQYPEVRPPAQWSKLVGRSHDKSFSLFSIGDEATKGLQMFAETGRSDALEEQSQREKGVCDEFHGPPIPSGRGRSETDFFIDGNHTRVSVVARIVPSPDWFIGLDGLDLCSGGFWIDAIAVEVNPLDAGTDDGFTFTAPNWPSEPRRKVTRITSKEPRHPANSFFYPALDQLPTIATFHLIKEKVYKLSSDQRRGGSLPTNRSLTMADLEAVLHQEEISNDLAPAEPVSISPPRKQHRNKHMRRGARRPAVACEVGNWEAWGPCSVSCGVGDQSRKRSVTKHARRGGRPCPPLVESRWCGEHTECPQNFFNW